MIRIAQGVRLEGGEVSLDRRVQLVEDIIQTLGLADFPAISLCKDLSQTGEHGIEHIRQAKRLARRAANATTGVSRAMGSRYIGCPGSA